MLGGKYGRIVLKINYVQIYLVTECALILMENITQNVMIGLLNLKLKN